EPMVMTDAEGEPVTGLTLLRAGRGKFCSIDEDANLWCWGGAGYPVAGPFASRVEIGAVADVALGYHNVCVVTQGAGLVSCWAHGGAGPPVPVTGARAARRIGVASWGLDRHRREQACFLSADGVGCWGHNGYNQLPLVGSANGEACWGNIGSSFADVQMRQWTDEEPLLTQLAMGRSTTLGLREDGSLHYYGTSPGGTCSRESQPAGTTSLPVSMPEGVIAVQVAMGIDHACFRSSAGSVYCWGANAEAQVGLGTQTVSDPLLVVP
ncbi:MAG: hypothetical protein VX405_08140, partial [Myxococcota bacterium]|nr:hypothetical protein [Myxococcota bacterium]